MEQNKSQLDSKKRFSDRVSDYVKFRPSYPNEIINFLKQELNLTKTSVIADIGSGTGLLTKLFLDNGNKVFGVEPNAEMRIAGETFLQSYHNFFSINGSSEQTTLEDHSVDFITAGQAYHWFNIDSTKKEFARILKASNNDSVILVWNTRSKNPPFNQDLEKIIRKFSNDYERVSHTQDKKKQENFFFNIAFRRTTFENKQVLDFNALLGRLLSSSYMLQPSDNRYLIFKTELETLFQKHQKNNKVTLYYETEVFTGSLS